MARLLIASLLFQVFTVLASPAQSATAPLEDTPFASDHSGGLAEEPGNRAEPPKSSPAGEKSFDELPGGLTGTIYCNPDDLPAVLVLYNRPIATMRARYAGIPPQERVRGVLKRFEKATGKKDFPDVTMKRFQPAVLFWIGDNPILGITASDLDPLGGESLDSVAVETLANLNLVLAEIRESRDPKAVFRAASLSLAATLVFLLALWLIATGDRLLVTKITAAGKTAIDTVAPGSGTVSEARQVTPVIQRIGRAVTWVVSLFFCYVWVTFILKLFPYTRPWGETLGVYLIATVQGLALGFLRALPNLVTVVIIVVIARFLTRLTRVAFAYAQSEKVRLPWLYPDTLIPTRRLLVVVIWLFAIIAMYPYLPGSGSEAFKGLSVLVGLMITLGGTGVVSQAMSGLVLMYARALRAGDYVRIGDTEGVVLSLGMLATKIQTPKREEITIPNSVVLGTSTKNYSRLAGEEGVILHTTVTIGYTEPWRNVHEQLKIAAVRTEGLKSDPQPYVNQTALSDFFVEYQLNAYLESAEERIAVLARLHANIQDTFNESGITIVSPHYVADPASPPGKEGEAK